MLFTATVNLANQVFGPSQRRKCYIEIGERIGFYGSVRDSKTIPI
jgi:hypothetical protein